jgi:glycolate oxidase FAD binding subunit
MPREWNGLQQQLSQIVGGEHLIAGSAARTYAVDGVTPQMVVHPGTQEDVGAVVAACGAAGAAVIPWGGGTAMGLGNTPARVEVVVCLDRLTRVVEFDAANLVVSAEAGVRLGDLQGVLAEKCQFLPLDAARLGRQTLGGLIATNASGPSRLLYGTARDLVLGMRVVQPNGERIRCGGKVIKNVSGYDMNKVFIGSLGTLGIITEVTFKLLPTPITRATVVGVLSDPANAGAAVKRTLESFLLPEAMELLDPQALRAIGLALGLEDVAGYGLAISLAGSPETVERQVCDFTQLLTEGKAVRTTTLRAAASPVAWEAIRDVLDRALDPAGERVIVKVAVPISRTTTFLASAENLGRRHQWRSAVAAHAGSGVVRAGYLIGANTPPELVRDELEALRREAQAAEGSLVVEAAPVAVKRHLDAWGKPGEAFPVMRRLKAEFDPRGLMNPGRFLGGI